MLSSFFILTSLEKAQILVEIFIGDLVHNSLSHWSPQYGLLLWYYQFVRAESCISFLIFVVVLVAILLTWWQSSYRHEEERFEIFGVAFPNESIEWWYDWMIDLIALATYFLYVWAFQIHFFWKPMRVRFWQGRRHRCTVTRYIMGERTYNIFKKIFATYHNYKGASYPGESSALEQWAVDELRSVLWNSDLRKSRVYFLRDPRVYVHKRTTFWDRLTGVYVPRLRRFLVPRDWASKRLGLTKTARKLPPAPKRWDWKTVDYHRRKSIKYARSLNRVVHNMLRKQLIRAYYKNLMTYKERSTRKISKRKWFNYMRRRPWLTNFTIFFNTYIGNSKTLSFNRRKKARRVNRGRRYIRYYSRVRGFRNLLPEQKLIQKMILRGRKRTVERFFHRRLKVLNRFMMLQDKKGKSKTGMALTRPWWHRRLFKQTFRMREASRGVQFTKEVSVHWTFWPPMLVYAGINGFCWEEDEFDMYEEEFEDWDLEFDIESGQINNSGLDWESDEDLRTLVFNETEDILSLKHSEEKQAWRDDQAFDDNQTKYLEENFDEDDDFLDDDILMFGVEYWSGVFEYFTDPVYWNLEELQLHMVYGRDMPPAWGSLQTASTHYRNLWDRSDGLLYSFYYHNCIYEDGVSSTDRWWDGSFKSWRHDGQPLVFLMGATEGKMAAIIGWYYNEYLLLKKEHEPAVYERMLEFDKEERQKRPHYHGMAFWRGYVVPKADALAEHEAKVEQLSERSRKVLRLYVKDYNQRKATGKYVMWEDDYELHYGEFDETHYAKWDNWEKTGRWE